MDTSLLNPKLYQNFFLMSALSWISRPRYQVSYLGTFPNLDAGAHKAETYTPIQYGFNWSIDGHVSSIAHHTARERVHACQRGTDVTHRKRRYLPQSRSLLYTYAQLLKVPPVMDHAVMIGLAVKLCPISKIYRCAHL